MIKNNKTEFSSNLTLNFLNEKSIMQNRSYTITRKPKFQGRIRVEIGNRFSRCG